MYKVKIDENFRGLEAVYTDHEEPEGLYIEALPAGEFISDYLFLDGKIIYDPISHPEYDPQAAAAAAAKEAQRLPNLELTVDELTLAMADLIGGAM